ncbi:ribbon-helix-helix domain-containing protein [Candidatus Desulforudis audaxviator]|uniref:ribbon-helix-helix domain-containing protein n=1 Tax=Candidatus Desulforudis audaxviator TaxID=471827 RepID=UPI0002DBDFA7|nr:ribbon-helix-helix domain-containing protein [Candidatus Desulforudis audaxviator]AZK60378.1 Programmed cell death antitoxin YdcD [Candidatus Desulforudis audaxviator]
MNAKIAVSLPEQLLSVLDSLARKWATTRSGAVAELLRRAEQEELEVRLRQGYLEMAELHKAHAELFLPSQAEVFRGGD